MQGFHKGRGMVNLQTRAGARVDVVGSREEVDPKVQLLDDVGAAAYPKEPSLDDISSPDTTWAAASSSARVTLGRATLMRGADMMGLLVVVVVAEAAWVGVAVDSACEMGRWGLACGPTDGCRKKTKKGVSE